MSWQAVLFPVYLRHRMAIWSCYANWEKRGGMMILFMMECKN